MLRSSLFSYGVKIYNKMLSSLSAARVPEKNPEHKFRKMPIKSPPILHPPPLNVNTPSPTISSIILCILDRNLQLSVSFTKA